MILSESKMRKLISEVLREAFSISTMTSFQSNIRSAGGGVQRDKSGNVVGSTKIESLATDAQPKFKDFFEKAAAAGYTITVTSGRRLPSHQWCLAHGDCDGITPAEPCQSDHQYGYAIDINASIEVDDKVKNINSESSEEDWKPLVDLAESAGLKWQGMSDSVHFYVENALNKAACTAFYAEMFDDNDTSNWDQEEMSRLERELVTDSSGKTIADILNIADMSIFYPDTAVADSDDDNVDSDGDGVIDSEEEDADDA